MRFTVPSQSDAVISVELTEITRGEWQLRVSGPPDALARASQEPIPVQMTVSPNLVPGVPFAAKLSLPKR